jgi:hypothetical protein
MKRPEPNGGRLGSLLFCAGHGGVRRTSPYLISTGTTGTGRYVGTEDGTPKVRAVPIGSRAVGVDRLDRVKIEYQDDLNEEIGTRHPLTRPKV